MPRLFIAIFIFLSGEFALASDASCNFYLPQTVPVHDVYIAQLTQDRLSQEVSESEAALDIYGGISGLDNKEKNQALRALDIFEKSQFNWLELEARVENPYQQFSKPLPYLISLRDLNWLGNAILRSTSDYIPAHVARAMMKWPSLWINHPQAVSVVLRVIEKVEMNSIAHWLGWLMAYEKFPVTLVKAGALKRIANLNPDEVDSSFYYLQILPFLKVDELSENARKGVAEWVNLSEVPKQINSIRYLSKGAHLAGSCAQMTYGHLGAFVLPSLDCATPYGEAKKGKADTRLHALIFVNKELVGVVKLVGDRSMLALQNVYDNAGHLVLAAGGVYLLSEKLIEYIEHTPSIKFMLNELEVRPTTFLFDAEAFQMGNNRIGMYTLLKEYLPEETLEILNPIRQVVQEPTHKQRQEIWQAFLKRLEQVRLKKIEQLAQ